MNTIISAVNSDGIFDATYRFCRDGSNWEVVERFRVDYEIIQDSDGETAYSNLRCRVEPVCEIVGFRVDGQDRDPTTDTDLMSWTKSDQYNLVYSAMLDNSDAISEFVSQYGKDILDDEADAAALAADPYRYYGVSERDFC